MFNYGLEKEYFVKKLDGDGTLSLATEITGMPHDDVPYLAEARGEKSDSIYKMVGNLIAEEMRMSRIAQKAGYCLLDLNEHKITKEIRDVLRRTRKGEMRQECLWGEVKYRANVLTAGVHIHFSNQVDKFYEKFVKGNAEHGESACMVTWGPIDLPKYVKALDKAFKEEIRKAHRQFGLYEMKEYGFEYRSLPMGVDLWKIAEVVNGLISK